MGGGYGNQSSSGGTSESALSKAQTEILRSRQAEFENWFLPELKSSIAETNINSDQSKAKMALMGNNINTSFDTAQKQTNQMLAQQGLLGQGGGVAAALQAKNDRARSSALAQAYYNTLADNQRAKQNLLQVGASLMPSTTTSAQYHQSQSSSGTQWNFV